MTRLGGEYQDLLKDDYKYHLHHTTIFLRMEPQMGDELRGLLALRQCGAIATSLGSVEP